jgi:hypothetical protein
MLAGNGSTPGTGYAAMLGQGTRLEYTTQAGEQVKLRISGGGFLDDLLSGSGQGIRLSVVGEVPHRTVLSGAVRNLRGEVAQAYLGTTVWGLGNFGDVRVKLTSPPFHISRYPFSSTSASSTAITPLIAVSKPGAKARTSSGGVAQAMNRPFRAFRHRSSKT